MFGLIVALAALHLGAPAATQQCGELAFDPGTTLGASNYGAGDITALRTNCTVARQVARGLKAHGGLAYVSHRFTCTGRATSKQAGARKDWRCTRTVTKGTRRVREVVTFYSLGA